MIFLPWDPYLAAVLNKSSLYDGGDVNAYHISGVALLALGVGLGGQAIGSTWSGFTITSPTWSSNPFETLNASMKASDNKISRKPGRCMMSVHQYKKETAAQLPKLKQACAARAHNQVKIVLAVLWALVPLGAIWGVVTYLMIAKYKNPHGVLGSSWSFLPLFTGYNDPSTCPAVSCTDGTSILNVGWSLGMGPMPAVGAVFLIAAFQAALTLTLHCAELLVNLSRDEGMFRQMLQEGGADPRRNSIIAAMTSWQTIILLISKALCHWLFGLAINVSWGLGVNMYPPQICYLTGFTFLVAIFATYVAFRRPKGCLPATYGHLQTMADIVDEYSYSIHWGHKYGSTTGRHNGYNPFTGTSNRPFRYRVNPNIYYGGPDGLDPAYGNVDVGARTTASYASPDPSLRGSNFGGSSTSFGSRESQIPLLNRAPLQ
jgi:hypothetical protein